MVVLLSRRRVLFRRHACYRHVVLTLLVLLAGCSLPLLAQHTRGRLAICLLPLEPHL